MNLVEGLLTAAVGAPSGDNTQPWRFLVDAESRRIIVDIDVRRDPSPMNAAQRMSRLAVGAALENMLRTLAANHLRADWSVDPQSAAVTLDLPASSGDLPARDEAVFQRVTNRRVYDARPVPKDVQDRLVRKTADIPEGVAIHWIFDSHRLPDWAELVSRADGIMFGVGAMRLALRANVRFDERYDARVAEGLSLASMEIARLAVPGFKFLTGLSDKWFKRLGGPGTFSRHARRLVASSSGMCLVTAADNRPKTDVLAGLAIQRAWLALAESGMSAQPMMTLAVLDNVLEQGSEAHRESLDRHLVEDLRTRFQELVPESKGGRPAFLLRFGFAKPVSGRTGRLPWQQFCASPSGAAHKEREAAHV